MSELKLTRRGKRMQKHSDSSLVAICRSGSLSAAAAAFELRRRRRAVPPIGSGQPNYEHVARTLAIFQARK